MGFGLDFLVMVLLFFGNGATAGNDFLSMMPTDAYWDAKHVTVSVEQLENDAAPIKPAENMEALIKDLESPEFKTRNAAKKSIAATGEPAIPFLIGAEKSGDPEVAAAAIALVDELQLHSKEQNIRRLMAIRTLGERKEHGALEQLKGYETSKDLFIAEYAEKAVAQIEGKPYRRPDHQKEVAGDLKMIPKASAVVGQCTGLTREPATLDEMVDASSDALARNMNQLNQPNGPPMPARKDVMSWVAAALLKVAEEVGDIRFDGVTISLSDDASEQGGSAIVILRGQYDEQAALSAMKRFATPNNPMKVVREQAVDILEQEETSVILPSNNLFIVIFSDTPENRAVPRQTVLTALKATDKAKPALADNREMMALIASVDTTAPIWAVSNVTDEIRKYSPFSAYKTLTLNSKITKDGTQFTFTGEGLDEEKAKASATDLNAQVQTLITQGKAMAAQMKNLAPLVDLLQSIKLNAASTKVTLTGEIKNDIVHSILGGIGPMLIGPIIEEHQQATPH